MDKSIFFLFLNFDSVSTHKSRQCFVEKTEFDTQRLIWQEIFIQVDRIQDVGPTNVIFKPACETTDEFKRLEHGVPFLRTFLRDSKSYLMPFRQ